MLNRIAAVFYKDLKWAIYNPKLLVIILMPLLISFLFQFTGKGILLGFSLIFTYTFIGCFLCSYLIIEEKKIDSLKCVLLSPLNSTELLIGKFLFPLCLCLLFSLTTLSIAKKFHLFFNPIVLSAIILMSAIICFAGLFLGLMAKNEQELGVIGPIFMIAFLAGISQLKEPKLKYAGYFPEFHLSHLIENTELLTLQQQLLHLAFLGAFFVVMLLIVTSYVQYFFSTDLDSQRINLRTILMFIPLLIYFLASGALGKEFQLKDTMTNSAKKTHAFKSAHTSVNIPIPDNIWDFAVHRRDNAETLTLVSKDDQQEIHITFRTLEPDENTFEARIKKFENEKVDLLAHAKQSDISPEFTQVLSLTSHVGYRTSWSWQCENELLVFSLTHPKDTQLYKKYLQRMKGFLSQTTKKCSSSVDSST